MYLLRQFLRSAQKNRALRAVLLSVCDTVGLVEGVASLVMGRLPVHREPKPALGREAR